MPAARSAATPSGAAANGGARPERRRAERGPTLAGARYFGVARSQEELDRAFALRRTVFCGEQGVSEEAEFDGLDDEATHIVGTDPEGGVIATCRLLFDSHWSCRLGRMAVAQETRRGGLGRRLLAAAEAEARAQGAREIVLHAQRRAEPFYAACWYRAEGETFIEEEIPHVVMRKAIRR